jgi:hypothetical protein
MARVSMKDRAAAVKPVAVASAGEPAATDVEPTTPATTAPSKGEGAPTSRINFEIDRAKRAAFKAWCAQNDTSIKDDLTAYIDSKIS